MKNPHSAEISTLHRDGSNCPLTGPHRLTGSGPSGGPACRARGGRRIQVTCSCGAAIPATDRLDAIVNKAVHLALHLGELTFRYKVDDGDGPKTIREVHSIAA